MTKKMLIDAAHSEETRVAIVDGTYLDELDIETAQKEQIKGNIYLAKVIRTEPSLQAAFVEYGGNRHGFLAFNEIHPDYYQIPIADKEKLKELLEQEQKARLKKYDDDELSDADFSEITENDNTVSENANHATENVENRANTENQETNETEALTEKPRAKKRGRKPKKTEIIEPSITENNEQITKKEKDTTTESININKTPNNTTSHEELAKNAEELFNITPEEARNISLCATCAPSSELVENQAIIDDNNTKDNESPNDNNESPNDNNESLNDNRESSNNNKEKESTYSSTSEIEEVGAEKDDIDEDFKKSKAIKNYKIQEVIKKGQVLLVQVLKEERGNKGAALTTYISLAGRYCVLMPNTAHGGGVSRKITNIAERKQLKQVLNELNIPESMGVIVRTAGKDKTKQEIKRDYDYLTKAWASIRDNTLKAQAPHLIHEEASLVKRALRDLYNKEIGEIIIDGEKEYKYAREFMKMLSPNAVKNISLYKNKKLPLFNRYQVEHQIAMIHNPVIQLKSGGYLVINQTEALVAIDINSGRATKERTIEETALQTNLEAAEEIARQLRLRDLAGLVVIDFIDMDEPKNNHAVERKMKESLKKDKARVQVGKISGFGLLEMSRQRMHSSFLEASCNTCPCCNGSGLLRSVASCALSITRIIEEEAYKNPSRITITVHPEIAMYILNYKRDLLLKMEESHNVSVIVIGDENIIKRMDYRIEKVKIAKKEEAEIEENSETIKQNEPEIIEKEKASQNEEKIENNNDNTSTAPKKKRQNRNNRNFYKKNKRYNNKKDNNNGENSTSESTPASPAPTSTVEEAPKEKKRGWWQKLIK